MIMATKQTLKEVDFSSELWEPAGSLLNLNRCEAPLDSDANGSALEPQAAEPSRYLSHLHR